MPYTSKRKRPKLLSSFLRSKGQKLQQDLAQYRTKARVRENILKSLQDPSFSIRTISGISNDTSLKPNIIVDAIQHDPVLRVEVKVLSRKSKDGHQLFMTRNRYMKESSWLDRFVDVFSSNRPSDICIDTETTQRGR